MGNICLEDQQTEQIINNFSYGSKNYDREAYVQNECAEKLGAYLRRHQHLFVDGEVLEIGCGTGFITSQIIKHFPERDYIITDICPKMLETCRAKFPNVSSATYSLLDGEQFPYYDRFALIVSGLAFQWFRHFQESISRILLGLKPGGVLLFSFLEEKSFPQWQIMCQDLGLPYTGNVLPKGVEMHSVTNKIPCISSVWEEDFTLVYPNALQCLKSFKRIGAATSMQQQRLSSRDMRRLLREWDDRCPDGVAITYRIANVAIQRL